MRNTERACANDPDLPDAVADGVDFGNIDERVARLPPIHQWAFRTVLEAQEWLQARDVVRDMILLALDATDAQPVTEKSRLEARAALAEALDAIEGVSQ